MHKKIYTAAFLFSTYLCFSVWVYTKGTESISGIGMMNKDAHDGRILYQELNCIACHQLFGLGGYLGPDLTHVISSPGKGPSYTGALLKYGLRQMPDFQLDSIRVQKLVAFLAYVDSSASMEKKAYALK
ncbi:MAG: cytochrome c [Bacteroidia bacterium]|nr:cytochrome c [Bacteroidia bacterium]